MKEQKTSKSNFDINQKIEKVCDLKDELYKVDYSLDKIKEVNDKRLSDSCPSDGKTALGFLILVEKPKPVTPITPKTVFVPGVGPMQVVPLPNPDSEDSILPIEEETELVMEAFDTYDVFTEAELYLITDFAKSILESKKENINLELSKLLK